MNDGRESGRWIYGWWADRLVMDRWKTDDGGILASWIDDRWGGGMIVDR